MKPGTPRRGWVAALTILAILLLGGLYLKSWFDWQPRARVVSEVLPRTTSGDPASPGGVRPPARLRSLSEDQWILQRLRGDDPAQRRDAVEALARMVDQRQAYVVENLREWLVPLGEAGLHERVLQVTLAGILRDPANTSQVSDCQQARVRALLALGRDDEALVEAKAAFNVATQKTVERAIELLEQALMASHGSEGGWIVERFRRRQNGTPDHLQESQATPTNEADMLDDIKVDPSAYADAIAHLAGGEPDYEALVGMGNLLLLSDRPDDARRAFLLAAGRPGLKGKKLFVPLEGLIRARRAVSGDITDGNRMLLAMRYGAVKSTVMNDLVALKLRVQDLYDAGRAIPEATVPDTWRVVNDPASKLPRGAALAGRLDHPASLAASATPADLRLARFMRESERSLPWGADKRAELRGLLDATPLTLATLFEVAKAFHLATGDRPCAVEFYDVISLRAHARLESAKSAGARLEIIKLYDQYSDTYLDTLWLTVLHDPPPVSDLAVEVNRRIDVDFLEWCPPDDPSLAHRRARVMYDLARIHHKQGQYERGVELLDAIDLRRMNPGEVCLVGLRKASLLHALKRYEEAIPLIKPALEWEGFFGRADAQLLYASCLERLGRIEEARRAMDTYRSLMANGTSVGSAAAAR